MLETLFRADAFAVALITCFIITIMFWLVFRFDLKEKRLAYLILKCGSAFGVILCLTAAIYLFISLAYDSFSWDCFALMIFSFPTIVVNGMCLITSIVVLKITKNKTN